jgi:hypothetical protein
MDAHNAAAFLLRELVGGEMKTSFRIGAWGSLSIVALALLVVCGVWICLSRDPAQLRMQWFCVELLFVALCVTVGIQVNGRPDGILIDDRNRISLERTQWVAWLIVLLGGYFTAAMWNVTHGAAFPTMQTDLFALLGIVSVSPVISNVIVDNKKNQAPQPAAGGGLTAQPASPATGGTVAPPEQLTAGDDPQRVGVMDANKSPYEASWSDLYLGEEVANRYVVDISRLQKLVITAILVLAYGVYLWRLFGPSAAADLNMPLAGRDFLALIGISHGAYLASKSTTKTAP